MVVMGVGAFILCTGHRWRETKEQQPWNNTKQIFPEQKTKKFFALRHLCPVHEVLSGIWKPLIPEQIVNLFGQGKCTFDCQSGNFKNYSSGTVSTRSCMLRIEKLINFNMACMWTFHTNSLLHGGICLSCMYTNNCEHFDKWFGTLYRDNSVLMRVLDTS